MVLYHIKHCNNLLIILYKKNGAIFFEQFRIVLSVTAVVHNDMSKISLCPIILHQIFGPMSGSV